jgi:uncharacterized membrane protein
LSREIFDANFLEKDLAKPRFNAYAVRVKIEIEFDFTDLLTVELGLGSLERKYEEFASYESLSQENREYYKHKLEKVREAKQKVRKAMLQC